MKKSGWNWQYNPPTCRKGDLFSGSCLNLKYEVCALVVAGLDWGWAVHEIGHVQVGMSQEILGKSHPDEIEFHS